MSPLSISPRASLDLQGHCAWLHEQSPAAALRLMASFDATVDLLRRFPMAGHPWLRPPRSLRGTRVILLRSHREVQLFYRATPSGIVVLRLLHAARDIRTALDG